MKIKELLEKQRKLDSYIIKNKALELPDKVILVDTCTALLVELGEFAAAPYKDKLSEQADIWHFLLSLHNQLGLDGYYDNDEFETICKQFNTTLLEDTVILNTFKDFTAFINHTRCFKHWSNKASSDKRILSMEWDKCLMRLCELGNSLDFTSKEVLKAYKDKYQVNINRQESGY